MFPYINLGPWHIGTFGLLLWLAAVCATVILHYNFKRNGVEADALNIVALSVVAGIVGATLSHELQNPHELVAAWRQILVPGGAHPFEVVKSFLIWFQAGFAWFGGLLAAIAVLMWQGVTRKPNGPRGHWAGRRMLYLGAPPAR